VSLSESSIQGADRGFKGIASRPLVWKCHALVCAKIPDAPLPHLPRCILGLRNLSYLTSAKHREESARRAGDFHEEDALMFINVIFKPHDARIGAERRLSSSLGLHTGFLFIILGRLRCNHSLSFPLCRKQVIRVCKVIFANIFILHARSDCF